MRTVPLRLGVATLGLIALAASAGCGGAEPESGPPTRSGPATTARLPGGTIVIPRSTTPATTGEPGTLLPPPEVVRFEVPTPLSCSGGTATAAVRYETAGADRVVFLVDDVQVPGSPPAPSGAFDIPVPCTSSGHVVLLTAVSPDNRTTLETRTLVTRPTG